MRRIGKFIYRLSVQWFEHDNTPAAAALAFYTVFSLSPLVIIAVVIAGWVFGPGPAEQGVTGWLEQQIGADAARVVKTVLASNVNRVSFGDSDEAPSFGPTESPTSAATQTRSTGEQSSPSADVPTDGKASEQLGIIERTTRYLATFLSIIVLIYGASLVFVQLRMTLNRIMGTEVEPDAGARVHIIAFLRSRLMAILFTLSVGALILATLAANTALAAVGRQAESAVGFQIDTVRTLGPVVSFLLMGLTFYVLLRFLPHGRAGWRETLPGAAVAAVLFEVGKYLIATYLARSGVASAYGASGTLVAVLLWVYYSAHAFLLGAEVVRYRLDGFQPVEKSGLSGR